MNYRLSLAAFFSLTLLLTSCDSKRDTDMSSDGSASGNLPNTNLNGGTDNLGNLNAPNSGGIPPSPRIDHPDENVDYSILAADTVYFAFDSSTVPPAERGKLAAVQAWMLANPGRKLYLAGHTDARGTAEYNRALGERRASSVREYLVQLGLDASLISTNSYGADRPAVHGDSEAAYAKNRRVEVGVVKQ